MPAQGIGLASYQAGADHHPLGPAALVAQRQWMRHDRVTHVEVPHASTAGQHQTAGLDTQREWWLAAYIPGAVTYHVVPVRHTRAPHLQQYLIRCWGPRLRDVHQLDAPTEPGDPGCSHVEVSRVAWAIRIVQLMQTVDVSELRRAI